MSGTAAGRGVTAIATVPRRRRLRRAATTTAIGAAIAASQSESGTTSIARRTYGWRNDRSTGIGFDVYKERRAAVRFGTDVYNGVQLTDEQNEFDLPG